MSPADRDLLEEIIEPIVREEGLDLESISVSRAGRRSRLQIVVDADGGVDLDRCADVSRVISTALDERDVMGEAPYTLEVSSPGVARALQHPRHWARAHGRLVRVKKADGSALTGRVQSSGEDAAVLDVDGTSHEINYAEVASARVQVEFSRDDDVETG